MTKQLLIYEQVEAVTKTKHGEISVKAGEDYEFARSINSVPIIAAEIPNAASEYPIVFTGDEENVMPVILMGFRDGENLHVDENSQWKAKYIPAFIRRYPFIFSSSDTGKTFTLCIDESFSSNDCTV